MPPTARGTSSTSMLAGDTRTGTIVGLEEVEDVDALARSHTISPVPESASSSRFHLCISNSAILPFGEYFLAWSSSKSASARFSPCGNTCTTSPSCRTCATADGLSVARLHPNTGRAFAEVFGCNQARRFSSEAGAGGVLAVSTTLNSVGGELRALASWLSGVATTEGAALPRWRAESCGHVHALRLPEPWKWAIEFRALVSRG
eukprot:g12944.t1